ncbi:MAG: hypothetical protein IT326_02515 [Anaerolineae bacterium]|nr:hypothetical protein [Anaerolineae bacterium]
MDDLNTLIARLSAPEAVQRICAADALAALARIEAIPALTAALMDADDSVRGHAAVALARTGAAHPAHAERIAESLTPLLAAENLYLRWAVADALTELGPGVAPAIPALLAAGLVADKEAYIDVLLDAIRAAGEAGIPALIVALRHPERAVRRLATDLLERAAAAYPAHANEIAISLERPR